MKKSAATFSAVQKRVVWRVVSGMPDASVFKPEAAMMNSGNFWLARMLNLASRVIYITSHVANSPCSSVELIINDIFH